MPRAASDNVPAADYAEALIQCDAIRRADFISATHKAAQILRCKAFWLCLLSVHHSLNIKKMTCKAMLKIVLREKNDSWPVQVKAADEDAWLEENAKRMKAAARVIMLAEKKKPASLWVQELKKDGLAGAVLAGEEHEDDAEMAPPEGEEEEDEDLENEEEEEEAPEDEEEENADEDAPPVAKGDDTPLAAVATSGDDAPLLAATATEVLKRPAAAPAISFIGFDPDRRLAFRTLPTGRKHNKEWALSWQLPGEKPDDDDAMLAVFGDGSTREVQGYTVADFQAHALVKDQTRKGPLWSGKAPGGESLALAHRADRHPLLSLKQDGKQILQIRLDALSCIELTDEKLDTEAALIAIMISIAEKYASKQLLRTELEGTRNEAVKALGNSKKKTVHKRPAGAMEAAVSTSPPIEKKVAAKSSPPIEKKAAAKSSPQIEKKAAAKSSPKIEKKAAAKSSPQIEKKVAAKSLSKSEKKVAAKSVSKSEKPALCFSMGPPPCSVFDMEQ
jgi:hypothetical protein